MSQYYYYLFFFVLSKLIGTLSFGYFEINERVNILDFYILGFELEYI